MAKLIITVEGGKVTQTLNFLDRNIKDNRYIYENGRESGIMDNPEKIYSDIPECYLIAEEYKELLDAVSLGKTQITDIMRHLNELEKEMNQYAIPLSKNAQEHVITVNNDDLRELSEKLDSISLENDKNIEKALKLLIHGKKS